MKTRFIVMLLSITIMPSISFAGVPTIDILGTPQAFIETVQTVASKIENSKQVLTIQKTMSKIGSAKASISDFINKQKDVITKYKEKMESYIAKGKEYKAKVEAYKAEALNYVDKAKEIKEQGVDNFIKDKAKGLADDAIDKLGVDGLDTDKIKDVANQVASGDVKGLANNVGLDTSKLDGVVDTVKDGVKEISKDVKGDIADGIGGETEKNDEPKKENNKMVKAPDVKTVRKSGGFSSENTSKALNEKNKGEITNNEKVSTEAAASGSAGIAKVQSGKETAQKAVIKAAETDASLVGKVKTDLAVADKKALKEAKVQSGKETAQKAVIKAAETDASSVGKVKTDLAVADKKVLKEAKVQSGKETAQKAVIKAAETDASLVGKVKSKEKNTDISKEIKKESSKLKRVKFKSSFGYGKIQNKQQLLFASVGDNAKTGETSEGVLIVPESISMYCNLNYEEAIKDKKMEECLRNINAISISEVTEDISRQKIDNATKDFLNGYVELVAATYFEAFEMYNDSLMFKNNDLSPIATTSSDGKADASLVLAKEMYLILNKNINKLRKLWSRGTSMKMYEQFRKEKFAKEN